MVSECGHGLVPPDEADAGRSDSLNLSSRTVTVGVTSRFDNPAISAIAACNVPGLEAFTIPRAVSCPATIPSNRAVVQRLVDCCFPYYIFEYADVGKAGAGKLRIPGTKPHARWQSE